MATRQEPPGAAVSLAIDPSLSLSLSVRLSRLPVRFVFVCRFVGSSPGPMAKPLPPTFRGRCKHFPSFFGGIFFPPMLLKLRRVAAAAAAAVAVAVVVVVVVVALFSLLRFVWVLFFSFLLFLPGLAFLVFFCYFFF